MSNIRYIKFDKSYWEAAKTIKDWEERLAYFESIFEYSFEGVEHDYSDIPQLHGLLTLVKPTIERGY